MSRIFVCLFMLFILSIAVRFGDCNNIQLDKNDPECDPENIKPGCDETRLSKLETLLKKSKLIMEKIRGKDSSKSKDTRSFGNILNQIGDFVHLIYPGTLWCGNGDIARNKDDLGFFKKTDACCREHDNCSSNIEGDEIKANVHNNGIFTRSACFCDSQFHSCLKNASNIIASKIGFMYFNILGQQCFDCVCPMDCDLKTNPTCQDKCIKYVWKDSPKM